MSLIGSSSFGFAQNTIHDFQNIAFNYIVALSSTNATKISNEIGRIDNLRALNNRLRYFLYTATLCTYSIYLSTSDLSSFIISNTDKHEFSSICKWISCSNDVMNDVDCVMKRDVYRQKIHVL